MMHYEFDAESAVIHLHAIGVLQASDPIGYFRAIDNDPAFRGPARELIYFVGLEDIAWTYREVFGIREAFEQYRHGEKIASGTFIVDSDLSYGMARMVISVFGEVFENFTIERR